MREESFAACTHNKDNKYKTQNANLRDYASVGLKSPKSQFKRVDALVCDHF